MTEFLIYEPLDMHLHLRDGEMLELVGPLTSKTFSGALVMPSIEPSVITKERLLAYKNRIKKACEEDKFEAYLTICLQKNYSYEFLENIKDEILAIKLYPENFSREKGIVLLDIDALKPTLEVMEKLGIPLCVHGETDGFILDREKEFIPIFKSLAKTFPNLKIIMEHITTKDAVELLDMYDNLYGTVTLHHLIITLEDVVGKNMNPHLYCTPIPKRPEDREALLNAALDAHPKLMFGSNSTPHPKNKKEGYSCVSGVFTAPIALEVLTELFEKNGKLENLNSFVSLNAQKIYNIEPVEKTITLIKKDCIVPSIYRYKEENVVPMYAGKKLAWSIKE